MASGFPGQTDEELARAMLDYQIATGRGDAAARQKHFFTESPLAQAMLGPYNMVKKGMDVTRRAMQGEDFRENPGPVAELAAEIGGPGVTATAAKTALSQKMAMDPSFVGMFIGENAQLNPAQKIQLALAKKYAGDNIPDETIRQRTMWSQQVPGTKGNWAHEIADAAPSDFLNKQHMDDGLKYGVNETSVRGSLNDKAIADAYPDIGYNTYIRQDTNLPYGHGWHDPRTSTIGLSPAPVPQGMSGYRARNQDPGAVAGHEIQHAIADKEGWAGGDNPESIMPEIQHQLKQRLAAGDPKYTPEFLKQLVESATALPGDEQQRLIHRLYQRNSGEALARASQNRMGMSLAERRQSPVGPLDTGYFPEELIDVFRELKDRRP